MQCSVDCRSAGPFVAAAQQSILSISFISIANCVATSSTGGGGAVNAGALLEAC
jgi:hypothetical protein